MKTMTTISTRSFSMFKLMRKFIASQHINASTYRCFGTYCIKLDALDRAAADDLLSRLISHMNLVPASLAAAA